MPNYYSPGVYVEEVDSGSRPIEGVATAVAAFVGFARKGAFNKPTLVTNWTQFTENFGEFMEGTYLAHAVFGYFANGGNIAYVVRVGEEANKNNAQAALPAAGDGKDKGEAFRVVALDPGDGGNQLEVEIAKATHGSPDDTFKLVVKKKDQPDPVEVFDDLTMKSGVQNVVKVVNARSNTIQLEALEPGVPIATLPAPGPVTLAGGVAANGHPITKEEYVGDSAARSGFGGLEEIDEVTMVCVPDAMAAYQEGLKNGKTTFTGEDLQVVQQAMVDHCQLMGDRVAILDAPPGLKVQDMLDWRAKTNYDSKYATLYWPWIKVSDPASGNNILVPPSGHMAGVWARSDATRGVHKAPANEVVRGAIALETRITKGEHDLLNPEGINCIREFPGLGIRVWGARTISSDQSWRYVNVRRLFNYIEESVLEGTQWVVFEPNDQALWARVRRTITAFLLGSWRDGALFGATPEEAFYVKCDAENNPPESVDAGRLICEIGIAPVKPAEFVVFRIAQYSGGASVSE
jgi:Bacteriophage tail sheath protein